MKLTAVFEKVTEGYIGFVEELPGANVQERTLEEAKQSLREVVRLILEVNRENAEKSLKGRRVVKEELSLTRL
jgi:predicted RNase H-like HicB family nuclease